MAGSNRSYLDLSQNYVNAKKGMRGNSAGDLTNVRDDETIEQRRILGALLQTPSIDNAYRQWKNDPQGKWEGMPFEDMYEEYDAGTNKRIANMQNATDPIYTEEDFAPDYVDEWAPELKERREAMERNKAAKAEKQTMRETQRADDLATIKAALDEQQAAQDQIQTIINDIQNTMATLRPNMEGMSSRQRHDAKYKSIQAGKGGAKYTELEGDLIKMEELLVDMQKKTAELQAEYNNTESKPMRLKPQKKD